MAKKYLKNSEGIVRAVTSDNLGLEKPLLNENYNIEVHNRNMDKIDSAIQEVKGKIDGLELVASNVKMVDGTTVEDTVTTNKTNISSLQTRVNNGQNHKITQDNGTVVRQDSIDLNTLTKTGLYYSANPTNSPMGIASAWYIDVKAMNSNAYVYQMLTRNQARNDVLEKYERNMHNGTWSEWREL